MNIALNADDLTSEFEEDILYRLAFIKPLRGIMQRRFERNSAESVIVDIFKNFHDECEWRYVPDHTVVESVHLNNITANPRIISDKEQLREINKRLEETRYNALWLHFNYDDIRYLIVPDSHQRIKLIEAILEIPEEMFSSTENVNLQKQVLISKILVLDEIRKDW